LSRYFRIVDGNVLLTFGKKHRGRLLHEVADEDIDYLKWIIREHADGKGFDEEFVVEVEEELRVRGEEIPYVGH